MKIDLVYLWVDGSDERWLSRRAKWLPYAESKDKESSCKGRTADNEELRYSLRSVENYAPWVNHIFIITDAQTPKWLDVNNPKVSIVDIEDILPHDALPLYNSCAIELGINNIEGLSEHYIYANDDMMFGREVTPEFFFHNNGKIKCRFKELPSPAPTHTPSTYDYTISQCAEAIYRDFGLECLNWEPHHQIDAYTKSCVKECLSQYKEWAERTISHRFRSREDMQRHILSLYATATGAATPIICRPTSPLVRAIQRIAILIGIRKGDDSKVIPLEQQAIIAQIKVSKPALICFNDSEFAKDKNRQNLREILNTLYPHPSQFEV